MIHHLFTHDWHPWRSRVSRINGAWTYSKDIVDHYAPHIDKTLKVEGIDGATVVSTCAPLTKHVAKDVTQHGSNFAALVQFLHTWPREKEMEPIKALHVQYQHKADQIIVVTAYYDYFYAINRQMKKTNVTARYLPMRIGDMPALRHKGPERNTAVWFGNLYSAKTETHKTVRHMCKLEGIELVTIADGKIYDHHSPRGRGIGQHEAWQVCRNSRMVFGVGRCALEAYALGCHVIVAGDGYGGTVDGFEDWLIQESTNFNTRKHTGRIELLDAIRNINAVKYTSPAYICADRIFCKDMVKDGVIQWQ